MHPRITDIVVGMFSWMLGGYFAGLTIGFMVFDPDLDVWALLGAVLAIAGLLLGILPAFRRRAALVLTSVAGYFAGMFVGLLLFSDVIHGGMIEALQNPASAVLTLAGAVIGLIAGIRFELARFRVPLFAFVMVHSSRPCCSLSCWVSNGPAAYCCWLSSAV
ncbi:MAG: hypothetical protein M5R40_05900 [Anaerolineae bacterium]|nr:hypothetical protein [Anaerolineae bacterium]